MSALDSKLACLANLPSMPVLLMDALRQLDGSQDLAALVDKIGLDPAVAARILRVVNSPFYGMPREIGSLREAIVLLGFNRIRDLLISVCFTKLLPTQHKDFDYRRFWRHSMAVAECSRQLGHYSGSSPDLAFTAGLLHDIGNLVIAVLFPEEFSRIIEISAISGIETEQQVLGFDHAMIGGKAAEHWNFPFEIQQAIEQHTQQPNAETDKSLSLLVNAANILINQIDQYEELVQEAHHTIHLALAILNISNDQAMHCANRGQQFAEQIGAML